ncbi:unnamed protein product [Didymodactylos carnosus]|uniref:Cullin family profile domain-containing protein n=1 Tax=Didymodactylos carnosus TaxID=1234261 RepID=A0A8S2ICQ3_9BILA|nr:unnamed protein product [Didymodactylos carnosus]CAF3714512.1 unnamed protein product [Didymodactylos carnosus]
MSAKDSGNIEVVWETLLAGIRQIFGHQTIQLSELMALYTIVYDYFVLGYIGEASPSTHIPVNVYEEYFEKQFLIDTEHYYKLQTVKYLSNHSVMEYLTTFEAYLNKEQQRMIYLRQSTMKQLIDICSNLLRQDQLEPIYAEFEMLLNNNNNYVLKKLFKLIYWMPKAKTELKKIIEQHIHTKGLQAIHAVSVQAINKHSINYIEDKDVFQKFYERMLAKRLVGQLSASDESEKSMIIKLKAACGLEYTSKFRRMFQDVAISKNMNEEYVMWLENRNERTTLDFSVMIFNSNSWPFPSSSTINLAPELKPAFDSFTEFYTKQHNKRKLIWLHQRSKGELQTLYLKLKFILQVSGCQMSILLLFNKYPELIVKTIQDETQMTLETLLPVIKQLLKSKIIKHSCTSEEVGENSLRMEDVLKLNTDYNNKRTRVNLNIPVKVEVNDDSQCVRDTIDKDRKLVIQAVVVRIMKMRQTSKDTQLIGEVLKQLSAQFRPDVSVIKTCIDKLIEEEYLKRAPNESDTYHYQA